MYEHYHRNLSIPVHALRLTIAAFCTACLMLGFASLWRVGLVDNAYVFLVYARNVAEGLGPVFNPGEYVEGYTSPLWTLMLSTGALWASDLESLSYWLGVVVAYGAVMLLARQVLRMFPSYAVTPFVLVAALTASPVIVFWAGSGMDTSLFLLTVTASLLSLLADHGRSRVSARTVVLLCIATLARPEGTLLAFFVGVVSLVRRRSILPLAGYVAFVAAMVTLRYQYYNDIIPNAFHVKVAGTFAQRVSAAVDYFEGALSVNLSLITVFCVLTTFAWRWERPFRAYAGTLVAWIILWSIYVIFVGGDNFAFMRFFVPIIPALFLLIAAAIFVIQRHANRWVAGPIVALTIFLVLIAHMQTFDRFAPGFHRDMALAQSWGKVGRWIAQNTPPDTVVATPVPGAMAFHSRRVTIDMLGMTDARIGRFGKNYPKGVHAHTKYDTDYLFERRPDIIVYDSSGQFKDPVYRDSTRIHRDTGYALFDFVHDPRCRQEYRYSTATLPDGTIIEMQRRLTGQTGLEFDRRASASN